MPIFGAIEAGGTKFVCGVGSNPKDLEIIQIKTTFPTETIGEAVNFLRAHPVSAVGIGSFGPVDLNLKSPTYGHITSTPKLDWQNIDLAGIIREVMNVPVGFDTDVNAAALGEMRWGAAQDVSSCLYLTIGTGIGGGAIVDSRILHGMMHPEMGHIRVPHDRTQDPFPGCCPFHGDCLEGLASGPAMQARWGKSADELPPGHSAWELEAHYLAHALADFVCVLSPERIVLGGGVMQQSHLFGNIRQRLGCLLNGYIRTPQVTSDLDRYVVPPGLGKRAGVIGALALAEDVASFLESSGHG